MNFFKVHDREFTTCCVDITKKDRDLSDLLDVVLVRHCPDMPEKEQWGYLVLTYSTGITHWWDDSTELPEHLKPYDFIVLPPMSRLPEYLNSYSNLLATDVSRVRFVGWLSPEEHKSWAALEKNLRDAEKEKEDAANLQAQKMEDERIKNKKQALDDLTKMIGS